MEYTAKNFDSLLGTPGFSDALLKNHFTLYQGYVTNTNKLAAFLKNAESGTPECAEVRRRFGWEWNGMRLHELYFGNMVSGGKALSDGGELGKVFNYLWGSFDGWKKDFVSAGAMRGIGWVILSYDPEKRIIFNTWVNEHDAGHLAGAVPLLVMDVFEHSFMIDYGLKKADYIDSFMKAIDWEAVEERLSGAM